MKLEILQYEKANGWNTPVEKISKIDSENTVVFIFGAPEFISEEKVFEQLKNKFKKSILIGCSGAGEIFNDHVFDESLSIAAAKFEKSKIQAVHFPIEDMSKSFDVGCQISEKLNSQEELAGIFVLSDGLSVNGSELIKGINSVVSPEVIVTGGLAGDGSRFEKTWTIFEGKPASGFVSAIGFYGKNIQIEHGSQGGWDIFGPERVVTKAEGNILYELDGQPALKLYKEYLGEKASELPASGLLFPLQIRSNLDDEKKISAYNFSY